MTEKTGRVKINDVAREVAKTSKQGLETATALQSTISSQLDAMRKAEAELLRKAKAEEEAQKRAILAAQQEQERLQSAEQPQEPKEAAAKADSKPTEADEKLVVETKSEPVTEKQIPPEPEQQPAKQAEGKAEAPKTSEAKEERKKSEEKPEEPMKAQQTPTVVPRRPETRTAAPSGQFMRPAQRLSQQRAGSPIRDDAAVRNAQRRQEMQRQQQGNRPPRPQQPRDGRPQSDRPQRPQNGGFNRDNRPPQNRDNRPGGFNRDRGPKPAAPVLPAASEKGRVSNYDPNKSNYIRVFDNEKRKSKKQLEREKVMMRMDDDEFVRGRKPKKKHQQPLQKLEPVVIEKATINGDTVTIKTLAEKIGKPASEIIKKLMMLGIIVTINNEIDFDTALLIASDFGVELEKKVEQTAEETLIAEDFEDNEEDLVSRPPVVTIMGHVDHGKTSLLDAIRSSRVTAGEAGGITQHIGAYTVDVNGRSITFLDTPGHEAFTAMRARGAQVTDAVILVVAADDGIMPQTIEAINHSKAAGVPIIVAVNKIDKPTANPDKVKQELTEQGLVWEEWGGDTIIAHVSAKTQEGIDELLEMVLLVADMQELKANPDRLAKGTIIEAKLDKTRGPVASILVQNGTLHVGNTIVAGTAYGRVRAMMNDKGERVEFALPSQPVEVLGFDVVPEAGDTMYAVEVDKLSRQVVEERKNKIKKDRIKATTKVSLDDLFEQISEGQVKELNIIVKADVQGSVEAVKQSLEKLSNDQVRVKCIHGGAGGITESDIMLASASNAIVIGFNVRPENAAATAAEREHVDVRLYSVIYNAIEDVEKAMKGLLEPVFEEVVLGKLEVRETFKVSGVGTIAGCYVLDGKITRNCDVRLIRDSIVVHEGKLNSLKRFKDDVKEVVAGYECGLGLVNYNDIKQGDIIEAFVQQEVEQ